MTNVFINTLVAFLIGGATLSFNFKAVDAKGLVVYEGDGSLITLGKNYRMETDHILAVSDGSVQGIWQKEADEIILQNVSTGGDVTGNPFLILKDTSGTYEITTSGKDADGLPKEVVMKSKTGAVYTVRILDHSYLPAPDPSLFVLNPHNYPDAVITDLR